VLSDDIFEPPAERILQTEVVMTIFDGRMVFSRI
jgi:predicted amidohydrolase YtcJ